ncbi:hypothetical protein ABT246_24510 [Streptomyces sp. NPDC001553]|uniref:hypothetical protein n=1 Tax=Streptomyces sp. NPDC001553 TaxID=3154385 RepID=UPI00331C4816
METPDIFVNDLETGSERVVKAGSTFVLDGSAYLYKGITNGGDLLLVDSVDEFTRPSDGGISMSDHFDWEKAGAHDLALHVSTQTPGDEDGVGAWDDPAVVLRLAELVLARPEHPKHDAEGEETSSKVASPTVDFIVLLDTAPPPSTPAPTMSREEYQLRTLDELADDVIVDGVAYSRTEWERIQDGGAQHTTTDETLAPAARRTRSTWNGTDAPF